MTADSSRVVSLSEGTPISTISSQTYTAVDIDLAQFGELFEWTDILGWTALLKVMEDGIRTMGEDCALKGGRHHADRARQCHDRWHQALRARARQLGGRRRSHRSQRKVPQY